MSKISNWDLILIVSRPMRLENKSKHLSKIYKFYLKNNIKSILLLR